MRLVQVTVPPGQRDAVVAVLEDHDVDYVLTDETGSRRYTAVVNFPVPTEAVQDVLDDLRAAGLSEDAYTVVVEAETVVSRRFERLRKRYEDDRSQENVARAELRATAEDLVRSVPTYAILTIVSAVIATAGLLLDSPAVVVGSMVIAPLIGPAMSASVGTVVDDGSLVSRGIRMQVLGLVLAVGAAFAFALFVQAASLVPPGLDPTSIGQVRSRLSPDFLSLVVALGAGIAGAMSLTAGVSSALVGVMIAVALIPPAATMGIGLAYRLPVVAVSSGVLTLVNVLSINLAALVVFWQSGYRPQAFLRREEARAQTVKRVGVLVVAIAVLSLFLGAVTVNTVTSASAERQIRADISAVLERPAYGEITLLQTTVRQTEGVIFTHPREVIVTVGVPPGYDPPDLADRIDERVDASLERDVTVEVRIVRTIVAR
ncbi:MAG: TIGR00341 family protein [Halanaeroarchaeum sp.]